MQFLTFTAPPLGAAHNGNVRMLATHIAHGRHSITPALRARAATLRQAALCPAGRIESGGTWADPDVHSVLAFAVGEGHAAVLRTSFEWYLCRGAFFHNDAHYGDVLFGVWYIEGPPVDLVFARASARVPFTPGSLAVFDPFEVHGVLHSGATQWQSEDYQHDDVSVFLGFELALDASVQATFGIAEYIDGPLISSRTRVSATTGTLD